ncbi:MAG: acetyl/propionyl/methylcrotonyl-CoA carboxylase subunit alpha [Alphaproteobacteria bacterium]|nr:MAG: acetyl/propionyl/methylcrotonyl-CoA carboxylase subunit alpha [Alphaproteobacteria bacterium]
MFRKLLIANRGEIACRIIATARRLGIATVAVHSDADAGARHVAMADEAVRIGPPPVAESYLRGAAIVQAARDTGADAIHPGYGFLSENPDFVELVEAAGLTFVGPPAAAIRAMGLKDAAKRAMEAAGVPVVPGHHGPEQDPDTLLAAAERIGWPVLIKARAGGGGKGMRRVDRPGDFRAALDSARREAQAAFGDPACLIEKYVASPRHIEIQVFADAHGNVVHLFERDCSLQRRHQKVIEEAPAPGMPAEVRAAMGRAAVEAARAIGYRGAGTVEFIADGTQGLRPDGFWFMEMNTRLQVEHPVTEAITGLDLVALQIRVAAGQPLPFAQHDLDIRGHAFEARIYAEDPARGFLPATGRIGHLRFPPAAEFTPGPVRVDSGVRAGDAITPHYDPMIAKLIVHGPDRDTALARLQAALAATRVAGTVTNIAFLGALARHRDFAAGRVDTGLIERDLDALTAAAEPPEPAIALAALAALGLLAPPAGPDPWDRLTGWRAWGRARQHAHLERAGSRLERVVETLGPGEFRIKGGAAPLALAVSPEGEELALRIDGHSRRAAVARTGATVTVFLDGQDFAFTLPDMLAGPGDSEAAGDVIAAPMPGIVRLLHVAAGDSVRRGQAVMVLEAMKMEHALTAPRDGVVAEVSAAAGMQVDEGMVLVRLEPGDG